MFCFIMDRNKFLTIFKIYYLTCKKRFPIVQEFTGRNGHDLIYIQLSGTRALYTLGTQPN